jgi:hypothetical protein
MAWFMAMLRSDLGLHQNITAVAREHFTPSHLRVNRKKNSPFIYMKAQLAPTDRFIGKSRKASVPLTEVSLN